MQIRRNRGGYFTIYAEAGSGFPLVLLHGNGEDHTYFSGQMDEFAKSFHVIAIDTRGHGASPRGKAPFSIAQFAQDLYEFLILHDLKRIHLLGFSDGGNIALQFALAHPEMVERLILNSANLYPRGLSRRALLGMRREYRAVQRCTAQNQETTRKAELLCLMVEQPCLKMKMLHTLHVPTLVIAGTQDVIRHKHTQRIAKALPSATLQFLPGDHMVAAKQPNAFNAAILSYLHQPQNTL